MWTLAGTSRSIRRRTALCWLAVLFLSLLLAACDSHSILTRPVLSQSCAQVGGAHAGKVIVVSPDEGFLRVRIEERGVSVAASIDANPGSTAESPVERLGTIQ